MFVLNVPVILNSYSNTSFCTNLEGEPNLKEQVAHDTHKERFWIRTMTTTTRRGAHYPLLEKEEFDVSLRCQDFESSMEHTFL